MKGSSINHKFEVNGYSVSHFTIISVKRYYIERLSAKLFIDNVLSPISYHYSNIVLDFENYTGYLDSFLYELKKYLSDMDNDKIKLVNIHPIYFFLK